MPVGVKPLGAGSLKIDTTATGTARFCFFTDRKPETILIKAKVHSVTQIGGQSLNKT